MSKYKGETMFFDFRKISLLGLNDAPFNYYIRIKEVGKDFGRTNLCKADTLLNESWSQQIL